MKKLLFLILVFILVLFAGCVGTRVAVRDIPEQEIEPVYETELNIHDIMFTAEEPGSYDACVPLGTNSFVYGDTFWIVVRFGGLQPDDNGMLFWYVGGDVFFNDEFFSTTGPYSYMFDLNDPAVERDKYLYYERFTYDSTIPPGLYGYQLFFLDGNVPDTEVVEAPYIEFSLLPIGTPTKCMQLWDELVGWEDK